MRPLTHDILDLAIDDLYNVVSTTDVAGLIATAGLDPDAVILAAERAIAEAEEEGHDVNNRAAFIMGAVVASYAQLTNPRPRTTGRRRARCG